MSRYDRCLDDMKKYTGTYPYEGFNPSKGDNYFAEELKRKYPLEWIGKAYEECGLINKRIEEFKASL